MDVAFGSGFVLVLAGWALLMHDAVPAINRLLTTSATISSADKDLFMGTILVTITIVMFAHQVVIFDDLRRWSATKKRWMTVGGNLVKVCIFGVALYLVNQP